MKTLAAICDDFSDEEDDQEESDEENSVSLH
jgi:hypothetical protein